MIASPNPKSGISARRAIWIAAGATLIAIIAIAVTVLLSEGKVDAKSGRAVITDAISSQLSDPSVLHGSTVVAGNASRFANSDFPAAKLLLRRAAVAKILSATTVFSDCKSKGRVCSVPLWTKNEAEYAFTKIQAPSTAVCTQSQRAGSHMTQDVHVVCVDRGTSFLYYYAYSLGGH